jgi:hypothetical protein
VVGANIKPEGGGMKKTFSLILIALLLFSIPELSWAKKEKTGEVKDNTFTDKKFSYQLTFLPNWKVKNEKEPSILRASLTKKNYQVDQRSKVSRSEFNIPTLMIMADTTSLSLEKFKEALFAEDTKKPENKDDYVIKLEFLTGSEVMKESEILVDSVPAKILTLRKPFERVVKDPTQTHSPLGDLRIINDFLLGYLLFLKLERNIYVIHFSCERQFFPVNHEEFTKIMQGWKFKRQSP